MFTLVLWQVFASSKVNDNDIGSNIHIETVTAAESVDSSDGVDDDNADLDSDSAFMDNIAELPALD